MSATRSRLQVERLEARDLLSTVYLPSQIRHAYGFDRLGLDGGGQTVAIVDAGDDPNIGSDLRRFDEAFGISDPPNFWKINQYGRTNPLPQIGSASDVTEIALDVEWAHAIAPGANILLVETDGYQNLLAGVDLARQIPGVVAVSMSWGVFSPSGYGEVSDEAFRDALFTTPANHIGGSGLPGGVTFVAASGDVGAPYVGYPGFSPNVLTVGGTTLYLDAQGNWLGETGWSGSGGGYSVYEPEPAYQYAVQYTGMRGAPDVSYDADPNTGFWIYESLAHGGWTAGGGTSAGAPQWAALIALADQFRAASYGLGSLDGASQTVPEIYNLGRDFIDITAGSNGYAARQGWDEVTGWGSPWAPWAVPDLAATGLYSRRNAGPAANPAEVGTFNGAVTAAHTWKAQPSDPGLEQAVDHVFAEPGVALNLMPLPPSAPPGHLGTDFVKGALRQDLANRFRPLDADQLLIEAAVEVG